MTEQEDEEKILILITSKEQMDAIKELLVTARATATADAMAAAAEATSAALALVAQVAAAYYATLPPPTATITTTQASTAAQHQQAETHGEDRLTHANVFTDGTSSAGQDTAAQQLITALGKMGTSPKHGTTFGMHDQGAREESTAKKGEEEATFWLCLSLCLDLRVWSTLFADWYRSK